MAVSMPCEQCGRVRRCRLHLDPSRRIVYLCGPCVEELGYGLNHQQAVRVARRDARRQREAR
jgi:hypothetical protein